MRMALAAWKGIANHALTEYFQRMPSSKSKQKVKQEHYNKNYHLIRYQGGDRDTRIPKSHCDLCNNELPKETDNIQYRINVLDEIDNSFESDYMTSTNLDYCSVPFVQRSIIFQVIALD